MSNTTESIMDLYIQPYQRSKLSKYIDRALIIFTIAIISILLILSIDGLFNKAEFANFVFDSYFRYLLDFAFIMFVVGVLNKSFNMFSISDALICDLFLRIRDVKLKNNIKVIIQKNKRLTMHDLILLKKELECYLLRIKKMKYKELLNENNLPNDVGEIGEIEFNIFVLKNFISNNHIIPILL